MKQKNSKQGWFKIFCFTLFFLPALLMGVTVKAQQCTIHTTTNYSSCDAWVEYEYLCPIGMRYETTVISPGDSYDLVADCECELQAIYIYSCNWGSQLAVVGRNNCDNVSTGSCCSTPRKLCVGNTESEVTDR